MKRLFDILFSLIGLLFVSPVLIIFIFLVYRQDKKSPFYLALRVGKDGVLFKMIKLRSMTVDSDKSGVNSTSIDDPRITPIGKVIRKYKLDEITQLFNVLIGNMSLVGPRPNLEIAIDGYTIAEKKLLVVRPGITDFSSIVFSDEGEILKDSDDPDLSYDQLIRPWKSRLGLVYVEHHSIYLDIKIIFYTIIAIFSKKISLNWVKKQLQNFNVDKDVINISKREIDLYPIDPPS